MIPLYALSFLGFFPSYFLFSLSHSILCWCLLFNKMYMYIHKYTECVYVYVCCCIKSSWDSKEQKQISMPWKCVEGRQKMQGINLSDVNKKYILLGNDWMERKSSWVRKNVKWKFLTLKWLFWHENFSFKLLNLSLKFFCEVLEKTHHKMGCRIKRKIGRIGNEWT